MTERKVYISMCDEERIKVLTQLLASTITNAEAARRLQISVRQTIRLKQRYREAGISGIVHQSRGKPSNHTYSPDLREQIVRLYTGEYHNWNFSHFREKLEEEHGITVSLCFIRKALLEVGIKSPRSHKSPRESHPPRPRRENAGELVQLDASKHDWFGNGGYYHLHGGIDDATGIVVGAYFEKEETNHGYQILLKQIITQFGIPECLYTDYRTTFQSNQHISFAETLEKKQSKDARFAVMCKRLGIGIISTSNPRAKGRIERLWGTFQDRLRNELIQQGITTIKEANRFLDTFIPKYNQRFASIIDYNRCVFVPVPDNFDYNRELALVVLRDIHHGSYVRYNNQYYILSRNGQRAYVEARNHVKIYQFLDDSLHLVYDDNWYDLLPVEKNAAIPSPRTDIPKKKMTPEELSKLRSVNASKNSKNTPWHNMPILPSRPKEYFWTRG